MNGEAGTRRRPRRGIGLLLLRVALAVTLLALILRKVRFEDIVAAMRAASPLPLVAGLSIGLLFATLKILRWWWMLRRLGIPCTIREAARSYLGGMSIGLVTPGRLGEVARSLYLRSGDRAFVSGAAFLDKFFDVLTIAVCGAVGCALQGLESAAVFMLLASAAVTAVLFMPAPALQRIVRVLPFRPVRSIFDAIVRPLGEAGRSTIALCLLQAVVTFSSTLFQFHFYLAAFGPAPWSASFFVLPLMALSNLIPLTISGVGVREWASVLLLSTYKISGAVAVNVALLTYLANSLAPGLVGTALSPRFRMETADDAGVEI